MKVSLSKVVALDDVLVGHLVAGVGIDLQVLDAMAGLPVELVERDLLALRRGRIERHGAGDEGQTQEAFPVGARGHDTQNSTDGGRHGFKTNDDCRFRRAGRQSRNSSRGRRRAMGIRERGLLTLWNIKGT
jgi:hypothetical protein